MVCGHRSRDKWATRARDIWGVGGRNVGNDESGSRPALMLLCVLGLVARPLFFISLWGPKSRGCRGRVQRGSFWRVQLRGCRKEGEGGKKEVKGKEGGRKEKREEGGKEEGKKEGGQEGRK